MKSLKSKRQIVKILPPDPVCVSTLESIRQNPKFARLVGFSVNNLSELFKRINPKHRVNAYYIMQEKGHINLVQALKEHKKNESLVSSVVHCFIKLITSSKLFSEEYCYKIIEAGIPEVLHDVISTINRSSESMKVTMSLVGQLAASRANAQRLIEAGLMYDCVDLIRDPQVDQEVNREAMETLLKFTSHPKAKQELVKPEFVRSIVDLIEQRIKDKNTVLAGLRILAAILHINEGYELLKANSLGTKAVVRALENHPSDKAMSEVSASILEKLATIEDIEAALDAVKSGNTSQVALLSSLLLVNDLLKYVVKKGGILELISIMERHWTQDKTESMELVRSCVIGLGRIAASDPRNIHEIFLNNGLEVINKLLEKAGPELVQTCFDTVQQFAVDDKATEQIGSRGTIRALIDRFDRLSKTESLSISMIEALGAFGKHLPGKKEVETLNGPRKILGILKLFRNNRDIQESGFKALSKIMTLPNTPLVLLQEDIIEHLSGVTKAHPDWKKVHLHAVKVFEILCQMGTSSPKLDKKKVFEALVDIVTAGVAEDELAHSIEATEKGGQEVGGEERRVEEKLTEKQEFELRCTAVNALQDITNINDVQELKLNIEETIHHISKDAVAHTPKALRQLKIFVTVALIPKIAELIINEGVPEKIARVTKVVAAQYPFQGKSEIVKTCVMFFEHLAHHVEHEGLRKLLVKELIKQATLETVITALTKDTEERTVLQTMKGLLALITTKIIEPNDKFTSNDPDSRAVEISTEKAIGAIISTIRKFEDERVQVLGLHLLTAAIDTNKGFIPLILSQGGTRLALSHLESLNTSLGLGKLNLILINRLARDNEGLNLLRNQHAYHAIITFLATNHNPEEIARLSAPLLQSLATDQTDQEIEEFIEALKGEMDDNDRLVLAETVEHIANLTLLERNSEVLYKKHALAVLIAQLKREVDASVEVLASKGVLEIHQRTVNALLSSISRIRAWASLNKKETVDKELVHHGILHCLATIILTRADFALPVSYTLNLLVLLARNGETTATVLQKCAEADLIPTLASFLELYKNDENILKNTTDILLSISNVYPERIANMAQKSFVRAVIRETKIALKISKDDPFIMSQASQNFRCLVSMADNTTTLRQIIEEGGEDLAIAVVEKYIRKNKNEQNRRERGLSQISMVNANMGLAASLKAATEAIVTSSLDLLDKVLGIPISQRTAVNPNLITGLISVLDGSQNPITIIYALKIIERASSHKELAVELNQNNALDQIIRATATLPHSLEVERTIGQIIANLGAKSLIPQITEQIVELSQRVSIKDPETVDRYNIALSLYAYLLATPKEEAVEGNSGARVLEAVQNTMGIARESPELMWAHVKVLERLGSRELKFRNQIRHSGMSEILVGLLSFLRAEVANKQKVNLLAKAIRTLCEIEDKTDIVLNGATGLEERREPELDIYTRAFLRSPDSVRNLLDVLEHTSKKSVELEGKDYMAEETVNNILTILAEIASASNEVQAEIMKHNGAVIAAIVYSHRLIGITAREAAREALRLLSAICRHKGAYPVNATEALLDKVVSDIESFEFDQLFGVLVGPNVAEAALTFLENLCNNEHDHTILRDKRCPEAVFSVVEKFKNLPKEALTGKKDTPGLALAYRTTSQAMRALRNMLVDPVLAKAIMNYQVKESVIKILNHLTAVTTVTGAADVPKSNQLTEIAFSRNPLIRCIQDTLGAIEELSANPKHAKEINILGEDAHLYKDLLILEKHLPGDTLASYRILGIFKHILHNLGQDAILQNHQAFEPIGEVAVTLLSLYPKLPIVASRAVDVKSLSTVGLTKAEVANLAAQEADNAVERARNDFSVLADMVENLCGKEVSQKITKDERVRLVRVTLLLKEIAADQERASKIEQHDLFGPLASILCHPTADREVKENVVDIFNRISNIPDLCSKLSTHLHVIKGLTLYIKNDGVQVLKSPAGDKSHQVQSIIAASETLERIIEIAKFTNMLPSEVDLNEITMALCLVTEPACNREDSSILSSITRTLATLAVLNEGTVTTIETTGAGHKLLKRGERLEDDLRFNRNLALFIASNATSHQRRTEFAKMKIFERLNTATQRFAEDFELNLNTCLAYTNLVLGHFENATYFLNSEAVRLMESMITKLGNDPMLVEAISRALNTLTSNNPDNVRRLGELGAAKWLIHIFRGFTENAQHVTIVECLKTVNNLATTVENAAAFVDFGFVPVLIKVNHYNNSSQIAILTISVVGSLATQNDEDRVVKIIYEGTVELINKFVRNYQNERPILVSAVDNVRNFMKNETCTHIVAQRGGMEMALKIFTTQDFDTELVLKTLNLFDDMLIVEDTYVLALDSDTLAILYSLLSTQRNSPDVLNRIFRIIRKLASDQERAFKVYHAGFLQAALKAVEEAKVQPSTTLEFFQTLHKISQNEDVASYVIEAGAAAILRQLNLNVGNKAVVEIGTKLLVNLLETEANIYLIVNNGAVNVLNTIIAQYPNDEVITFQAYHALSLITLFSDEIRLEMLRSGLKANAAEVHRIFLDSNKADMAEGMNMVLENIEKAIVLEREREKERERLEEEESPKRVRKASDTKQLEPERMELIETPTTTTESELVEAEREIIQAEAEMIIAEAERMRAQAELLKEETQLIKELEKVEKIEQVVEEQKQSQYQPQSLNRQQTTMETRNQRLNIIREDPTMKEAWTYLFRGKILKMWTPHGTNWPMHLLLSDDGYSLTLKGKKKWETTIRLDDVEGIWKGYFSNSPFTKPKKLFTKSPDQDLCFFFVTHPSPVDGSVKTLYFECQTKDEREKFVDYLVQILKRLIVLKGK